MILKGFILIYVGLASNDFKYLISSTYEKLCLINNGLASLHSNWLVEM